MDSRTAIPQLQRVVSYVGNIPIFRDIYPQKPQLNSIEDFQRLPLTSRATYARLGRLSDAVQNPWDMTGSLSPWDCNGPCFPTTVLQGAEDEQSLQERAQFLLRQMGLDKKERVTFLTGPHQIYAASELAEILIYLDHPCQIVPVGRNSADSFRENLSPHEPRTVFLCLDASANMPELPASIRNVATFNLRTGLAGPFRHYDILRLDEIPLLGVSNGDGEYQCPSGHFFLEESDKGDLVITTVKHSCMPFIRYDTGIQATVSGDSFRLRNT